MATDFDDYSDEDVAEIPKDIVPALSKATSVKSFIARDLPRVNPNPDVSTFGLEHRVVDVSKTGGKLITNPKFSALENPLQGPLDPAKGAVSLESKIKNHHLGLLEKQEMAEFAFQDAMLSHDKFGAKASTGSVWGESALGLRKRKKDLNAEGARKRIRNDDPADTENFRGPWASFEGEAERKGFWKGQMEEMKSDQQRIKEEENIQKASGKDVVKIAETSRFYGKVEYDYQGRSWMEPKPHLLDQQDRRNLDQMLEDEESWCFLPKKVVHTFTGHTQGVQTVRLFPKTGHLLLSAGLDCKVKIWDFYNQRQCLRDYMGHDVGVRDVKFTDDGTKFYSCSFDKNINLWDTETGKIIVTMTNNKTPYCLAVHPNPAKQNTFIAGCSNKKAVEWDANSGKIVQEYDEHLGSVNSVTFCEEGKKIVTTSDDKKILIWEYGIPVVMKYISEPSMHSIPSIAVRPCKKWLVGQSMDNKLVTYEATGRFKYQASRKFVGHMSAGFACEPSFSPDGNFVASGDGNGRLFLWGWKNCRLFKSFDAHTGACMGSVWHPKHTSKMLTCGYDGLIKLWD
ncbi:unnamed protein product [Amoebophrya sp. A25]|nr:unnamed protein product [Amoebophrya sp. A25]|eukprot:GSA25T00020557001.1